MKISIVVPLLIGTKTRRVGGQWDCLNKLVSSIKKYQTENHEIIVVYNSPIPISFPYDVIGIPIDSGGQCYKVNLGVSMARNEYVMVVDEDMVFPPNWEELINKAKDYDFLSGNLMESGKVGGVAAPFVVNDCGDVDSFDQNQFERDSMLLREERMESGFGFPLIFKKNIWFSIEGYDTNYDPWGSNCDSDLEYKLMLVGIEPKRWRGTVFYHFAQVSGTFAPEQHQYWMNNRRYFEQKWGLRRADPPDIWFCNFKIDKENLKYKPSWAILEGNPNLK